MGYQVKKNLGAILRSKGVEFRVWAPFAKSVGISGTFNEGEITPMKSEDDGYWSILVAEAEPGNTYRYVIDTGEEILWRNDPRARVITSSDNGMSVVTDNEFDWGDDVFVPPPVEKQIIYELHVGTFNRPDAATTGTFYDVIDKLDYIQSLGVNMIELMPVTSMAFSNGWGYNTSYIYSIENSYGGRYGLMKFIQACHERDIGVIVDVVYNHFFPESDLWKFDGWDENDHGGIYFYTDKRGETPWGGRPNYGRPEVRQFILDNITMWFHEFRLDGLRVDSTVYMRNTEGQDNNPEHDIDEAWQLLQDITRLAHKVNPNAILIAEDSASNSYITKSQQDGGCGFDAQWELGFPHVIREALGLKADIKPSLQGINFELTRDYNGNAFEKIVFSDSHDTAANGSVRLNEAVAPGNAGSAFARQHTLLASAFMLTAPGVPMLLQGSEFMQGGSFNDWQELHWAKSDQFAGIVLAHQHLIDLRTNKYGNTGGLSGQSTAIFHQNDKDMVIGYQRWEAGNGDDDVLIIMNFSANHHKKYDLVLPYAKPWMTRFNSSWHGYSADFKQTNIDKLKPDSHGKVTIEIAPFQAIILSIEK